MDGAGCHGYRCRGPSGWHCQLKCEAARRRGSEAGRARLPSCHAAICLTMAADAGRATLTWRVCCTAGLVHLPEIRGMLRQVDGWPAKQARRRSSSLLPLQLDPSDLSEAEAAAYLFLIAQRHLAVEKLGNRGTVSCSRWTAAAVVAVGQHDDAGGSRAAPYLLFSPVACMRQHDIAGGPIPQQP